MRVTITNRSGLYCEACTSGIALAAAGESGDGDAICTTYTGTMYLLLAALLVAADQASKWWAKESFAGGGALELGLGFRLTFVRNTGAAFGLLRDLNLSLGPVTVDGTLLLGLLSTGVALALIWYLVRRGASIPPPARFALALVLAGAVGNMIDRLQLGFVVDFIHFRRGGFDFPVFNLADSYVVAGGVLLFLGNLFGGSVSGAGAEREGDGEAGNDDGREGERVLAEPEFFRRLDRHDH